MSLTRKMLEALNVDEKAIEQIIEAHTETVNGLKDKLSELREKAEKYDGAQKELDALQKGDYKSKYEAEKKAFEAFKAEIGAKEAKAAKEAAVKAYFESKNISGKNLEIAMRGAYEEIAAVELDENGKIKDSKALDALVSGTFSGLVVSTQKQGAPTVTPPSGGKPASMTKRQKAWGKYIAEKGV